MAKAELLTRAVRLAAVPTTPDETTRSATVVVATDAEIGGMVLPCREGAVEFPSGPVPLLLDHDRTVGAIAGRLERFELVAGELRALAVIADAPAAETAWPLVKTGAVGVSVGAEVLELSGDRFGPEIATRWRIREASLTPVPADPACVIRSAAANPDALEGPTMTATPTKPETTEAVTRAERERCSSIQHQCDAARMPELAAQFVEQGLTVQQVSAELIDRMAAREAAAPTCTHVRVTEPTGHQQAPLEIAVQRAWERKAEQPLWLELRAMGHRGRNGVEVMRSALSTSDLPLALTGSGNRLLMTQFANAPQGVRMAATVRQLADYRTASTLDVGLVGKAQPIKEGGEVKFGNASEQAASYKPTRHGLGLTFTPESLANDDLAGLDLAINELGAAMLEAEAEALAELLDGNALGGIAPDGKRLFHADHGNTVAGPLGIGSLGEAVAKLRRQTTIGGRFLYQEPGAILCSPDIELTVRQLLSDTLQAAEPANVNPWRDLEVAVDPQLGQQFVYLLPAGARRPLELGRLTPAPQLESETQFETGNFRVKSEHAFGCAVVDHRPIVRLTVAA